MPRIDGRHGVVIPDPGVMDSRLARSAHVNGMLATAAPDAKSRWEELYRSSRDDLYAYVATCCATRRAKDVTALSFERAYRRRRSFNARRGNERAWLFGIARNAALDELRRRRRQATLAVDPEDLDAPAPEDETDVALRRTTVRAALAELSPRERELIALKFHAGLSNAEVAEVIGVSASNAGTLLHRTMEKFREACHATP